MGAGLIEGHSVDIVRSLDGKYYTVSGTGAVGLHARLEQLGIKPESLTFQVEKAAFRANKYSVLPTHTMRLLRSQFDLASLSPGGLTP